MVSNEDVTFSTIFAGRNVVEPGENVVVSMVPTCFDFCPAERNYFSKDTLVYCCMGHRSSQSATMNTCK